MNKLRNNDRLRSMEEAREDGSSSMIMDYDFNAAYTVNRFLDNRFIWLQCSNAALFDSCFGAVDICNDFEQRCENANAIHRPQ